MLVACGCGLVALTLLMPWLHPRFGGSALIAAFVVHAVAIGTAWRTSEGVNSRQAVGIILATGCVMRLALVPTVPTLSSDIYRYIWDGRVQAAGINPYQYIPAAVELAHLRDPDIYPNINRAEYAPTIYPPAAQAFFHTVTRFGETVAVMKLALVACEGLIAAALMLLLHRLQLPMTRVAAFAWHPLSIWEVAGNGHVDALMIAGVMAALLLAFSGRSFHAGAAAALAALVKPTAVLMFPVIWRPWDWRMPAVVITVVILAYLPFIDQGSKVIGFLPGYVREEGFVSGDAFKLLWLLQAAVGPFAHATAIYSGAALVLLIVLAVNAVRRKDRSERASIDALMWLLTAFLVAFSPNYPWYFLVLVPFLSLAPTATGWVLTVGSVLFYDVVPNDVLPAYESRIAAFTLALIGALIFDLVRWRSVLAPFKFGVSR